MGSPDCAHDFSAANTLSSGARPPAPNTIDTLPGNRTPSTTCMTDVHVVTSGTSTAALVAALHRSVSVSTVRALSCSVLRSYAAAASELQTWLDASDG